MARITAKVLGLGVLAAGLALPAVRAAQDASVSLCDGQGQLTLTGVKPGVELPPDQARKAADAMMQQWRRNQGEARWAAWVRDVQPMAAHPTEPVQAPPAADTGQPTKFTARDQMIWKREEKKWIDEGYKAYHNAKALGGTIGVSCDMCHPDGSNTHPESYPKYQAQLKKVALLRDMVNWCIENPLKGKPLAENDPTLRAVEAYILSTRKGVALEPGKH